MLLGYELLHSLFRYSFPSEDKSYEFKNVPFFVKKTASLQANMSENIISNRKKTPSFVQPPVIVARKRI